MNAKKQGNMVSEHSPWWLKILDRHGITTLISLAAIYGGWMAFSTLGDRHFKFLDSQSEQMKIQTSAIQAQVKTLETIAGSNLRQEDRLDDLGKAVLEQNTHRRIEHESLQKAIQELKK